MLFYKMVTFNNNRSISDKVILYYIYILYFLNGRLKKKMSRMLNESWRIQFKDLAPHSTARAKSTFSYSKVTF